MVDVKEIEKYIDEIGEISETVDDLFDHCMIIPQIMLIRSRREQFNVILDVSWRSSFRTTWQSHWISIKEP